MCDLRCLLCHEWKYSFDEYCAGSYCNKYKNIFTKEIEEKTKNGVADGDDDSTSEGE